MERKSAWWQGRRGEWYVVVQGVLFVLVGLGPRTAPGIPLLPGPVARVATVAGAALILAGGALSVAGLFGLGRNNLTALPYPRPDATLVVKGPYAIVRNPIYSGLIFAAFGWGLWVHSWLTLGYALLLFALFDVKSRREERWLCERFPQYRDYKKRVKKLIPWVY